MATPCNLMVVVKGGGALSKLQNAWIYWRDGGAYQVLRADATGIVRTFSGSGSPADPGSYVSPLVTEEGRQVEACFTQSTTPAPQKSVEPFLAPKTVAHGLSALLNDSAVVGPGGVMNTIRRVSLGRIDVDAPLPLSLVIESPTANQQFAISDVPEMPRIDAKVKVVNAPANAVARIAFKWDVEVRFNPRTEGCAHGPNRPFLLTLPSAQQVGDSHTITFPSFMGGHLTIKVTAELLGQTLSAQTTGTIVGTNPHIAALRTAIGDDTLIHIAFHESGFQQFHAPTNGGTSMCALWSGDNLGGVGLLQLTNPPPTDEQVWNWMANVAGGRAHLQQTRAGARAFPSQLAGRPAFRAAVGRINAARSSAGRPPLNVVVPPWTAAQIEDDAIRGFNGYGDRHDVFGGVLREFRLVMSGTEPMLHVDEATLTGTAIWERVPVADRGPSGDPDYVSHVHHANPPTN